MLDINDVIKVSRDIQENIRAGNVGTVVDVFGVTPSVYLVEFIDDKGHTIEMIPLKEEDMNLYWVASTGSYVDKK